MASPTRLLSVGILEWPVKGVTTGELATAKFKNIVRYLLLCTEFIWRSRDPLLNEYGFTATISPPTVTVNANGGAEGLEKLSELFPKNKNNEEYEKPIRYTSAYAEVLLKGQIPREAIEEPPFPYKTDVDRHQFGKRRGWERGFATKIFSIHECIGGQHKGGSCWVWSKGAINGNMAIENCLAVDVT
ncbi:hypothetical protein BU17DRAFT_62720 [Hysterangium stoloniferum]|nr:hypothetical protein BU17DRAFT_62720 [Hysterangium stoloniferum]